MKAKKMGFFEFFQGDKKNRSLAEFSSGGKK